MDRWREVIDLGARLGLFDAEAAARALARAAEARPADVTPSAIAEWLGISEAAVEALRLLATSPHATDAETRRLRTEGIAGLAAALESPPTVRRAADAPPTLPLDAAGSATPSTAPAAQAAPTGKASVLVRPKVPRNLGPYELGEELGHGGMGIVFRARHVKLGSGCAVKVLIAGEHASPEAIARFQREAAAVARMGKHPNIVTVHDLGEEGSLSYYAMELVEGETLRRRLAERPYAPREAAALLEKVARALHFAHGHGVIHRDIKPDNIVVRTDGEPQVMDFGLAREVGSEAQLSVTGQVMGTPAYMAPEQVRGDVSATDARTDVYAVGAVLYEALTGIPPHGGQDLGAIFVKVLSGDIVPPRRLRAEVPRDVETICMKCLELSAAKRYASAEALAEDLARFQRGEPVHARPVGRAERFVRRVRRHPLVSGLIAASVVFAIGMGWKFLGPARVLYATDPADARVEAVGATMWGGGRVWPARTFKLRVTREGYLPREVEVTATPGATIRLATVKLDSAFGTVRLVTDPDGAEVLLDDLSLGAAKGAAEFRVAVGNHRLGVRAGRYEADERLITVESGKAAEVGRIALAREHGTLELTGTPREISVVVWDVAADRERTRLSPPATLDLETGSYELRASLHDYFSRTTPLEVRKAEKVRKDVVLGRQTLWAHQTGGVVSSSPALGDLNGDGCLDCVVGAGDKKVYALSGRNGAVLWAYEAIFPVKSSPALVDLNGDGCLDCVVGVDDHMIDALSGREGAILWASGGPVHSSPALGDLNADGVPDCVVGLEDNKVCSMSGRDGAVLWAYETGGEVTSSPALGDLAGDGCLDCVVGSDDGKVYALSGEDGAVLWAYETGGRVRSSPALGDLNGDGVLDCVVGSEDSKVYALSGRDGAVFWAYETGDLEPPPPLEDLNGDGCLDCLVVLDAQKVCALSGRDGAVLWVREPGGILYSSPVLGDLNGDGCLDCVVGSWDDKVYALSGIEGAVLWAYETGGEVWSSPALGDLNGDGCLDCVVGSDDNKVYALSGRDGAVLWAYKTGDKVRSSPALGDLSGDGRLDCVVGSYDKKVYALSGREGAVLWAYETGDGVDSSPALADLNGDGCLDCVVGSGDKRVYALSGIDGAVLWSYKTGSQVSSSPALGNLDGDGCLDCVVGSYDNKVYALSGRDGALLWADETGGWVASSPALGDVNGDGRLDCVVGSNDGRLYAIAGRDPKALRASARQRLGFYRHGQWWPTLAELATERLAEERDPWARAVTSVHLGLARLRLGDPKAALDAFAEARRPASGLPHLRAPDAAVFEWVATSALAGATPERRDEARKVLLDALAFQPDTVFDAVVEVRDLLTPKALADLRTLLDKAPAGDDAQLARAMLLAAFTREGATADLFTAAERRVLAKVQAAQGSSARWHGYLALLADAEGDRDRFRRAYAAYLDQPRRPESLDALLAEAAKPK